jgi:hypothetical protein
MPDKKETPTLANSSATVHIDADSEPFKFILDIITAVEIDPEELPELTCDLERVLEVGEQFGFTQLPRLLLPMMHFYASVEPWEVFRFAAKNDFHILACYAIDKLALDPYYKELSVFNFDNMFDDIPGRYTVPLVRNMALFRTDTGATDWEKVAVNFPSMRVVREVSLGERRLLTTDA